MTAPGSTVRLQYSGDAGDSSCPLYDSVLDVVIRSRQHRRQGSWLNSSVEGLVAVVMVKLSGHSSLWEVTATF